MKRWWMLCTVVLLACLPGLRLAAEPLSTHPRLWITSEDLPRLRQWASPQNPVYTQGLRQLATWAAQAMDNHDIPDDDNGGSTWSAINTEEYAALFAFMALVDPDPAARPQWAQRGRTLLLHAIGRADTCMRATPPTQSGAFCTIAFSVSDRSRWTGAAFPLAADWLQAATTAGGQPVLSAADRATLRRVFLVWSRLSLEAYPNPYNNPPEFSLPVGTIGEPLLRLGTDLRRHRLRFAGNNYFAGHMRNMGLRAIAIDPADDVPDALTPATYLRRNGAGNIVEVPLESGPGALRGLLTDVLGGWLFVQDYLLRHDSRGGLPQEGMEYAPTSIGIPAQFLFALETAGYADQAGQARWGTQVAGLSTNPFYRATLFGLIHSQSPRATPSGFGLVYRPAWYGDGEQYYQNDPIDILGPLALHAMRVGDTQVVDAVRWVQRFIPPDGNSGFAGRTRANGSSGDVLSSLMYFLLFDPNSPASLPTAPDPRPALDLAFWSEGMGRLLTRTGWDTNARWFDYRLSYNAVDHQHGDGNLFEFYRAGEWLTKGTLGYGNDGGATDYKNGVTIQNTLGASVDPNGFLGTRLRRGAQMPQNRSEGDPVVLARSEDPRYSAVTGDATRLYNAWYENGDATPLAQRALDVAHASRSVLWLKPDHIVVYDRARSHSAGRAKRFWLNLPDRLPSLPQVSGSRVTATTPGGQRLFVTTLLPTAHSTAIVTTDPIMAPDVNGYALGNEDSFIQTRSVNGQTEKYATRLRVEADNAPQDVRFLHVLQGADAATPADGTTLLASEALAGCATPAGAFDGAAVASQSAWFARDLTPVRGCLALRMPAAVTVHTVTGLAPYAHFQVTRELIGAEQRLVILPGGPWMADAGGVLRYEVGSTPAATAWLVASATEMDFGTAAIGSAVDRTVTITNRGTAAAPLVASMQGDTALQLGAGTCTGTLAPGAQCNQTVRFQPTTPGYRSATLHITSGASTAAVTLRGIGEPGGDVLFRNGFDPTI
ncbi:choice-of-anchor D domain-containing protein [Tahibacter amnicola]|uniref:Choice-of-anchor D domain-containing protein n=1 Tax=Tahibacter amnicola TaxID=2976241 RepID=A0ABY6BHU4_9GAMM|nr:choice-of-anchor D domain-containing protein [Tahibacter amnicola]UXI69420.1 choice-of-anchor D domain-containing protein [Tahibacter amnicola]